MKSIKTRIETSFSAASSGASTEVGG